MPPSIQYALPSPCLRTTLSATESPFRRLACPLFAGRRLRGRHESSGRDPAPVEAVGDPDRQVDAGHVLEGLRVEQNEVAPIGLRVVDEAHGDSLVLTGVGTGRYEHELADRAPRAERLEVRAPRRE